LIEILIGLFVLSVIITTLASLAVWLLRSNMRIRVETEVLENAQSAMQRIVYEIREAESIYYPTSSSTQLSLETDLYLPEGESFSYIDFFVCGHSLCFKQEGEPPVSLTSDNVVVNNFNLSYLSTSTPSVQIELEIGHSNPQYQYSVDFVSTAYLRTY